MLKLFYVSNLIVKGRSGRCGVRRGGTLGNRTKLEDVALGDAGKYILDATPVP